MTWRRQYTDVYRLLPADLGWHLDITDPKTRHHVECHISSAQIAYMADQDRQREANDYVAARAEELGANSKGEL